MSADMLDQSYAPIQFQELYPNASCGLLVAAQRFFVVLADVVVG